MTYTKPEVTVLGEATDVIRANKPQSGFDSPDSNNPAYELDE